MTQQSDMNNGDLLMAVLQLSSAAEFTRFLEENPQILGAEALAELQNMSEDPVAGPAFEKLNELIQAAAAGEPRAAWHSYQCRLREVESMADAFDASFKECDAALAEHDTERAIAIATELLPRVHDSGLVLMESALHEVRGKAFVQRQKGDHAENLEAAIADFHAAVMRAADESHRAMVLMHAGIAFRERVLGDRSRNIDQAIALFREALDLLDESGPPDWWAILRMNLASTLLAYEGEGRRTLLREAAELCRRALEYRTLDRDAIDWAYTQINYAFILQDLAALGDGDISAAKKVFDSVIAQGHRIDQGWLVGTAHCALGRIELLASQRTPEEQVAAAESTAEENSQRAEDVAHLEGALQHFEAGLPLTVDDWLPARRGRALDDLAEVLTRLDRPVEAIAVGKEALSIMRPTTAPRQCLSIGARLGDQLASQGNWDDATAAFADALEAAELSFHNRLETTAREDEATRAGELARWAAMAFARVGRLKDAVLALESGRTRELRRRIGLSEVEEERLADLPGELRERFEVASTVLRLSPLDDSSADAGLAFQELLEEIRRQPGMADFAAGPHWDDLVGAVDSDWPLVYVDPTPWGRYCCESSGTSPRLRSMR